jgi:hypothetical protein
MEWGGIEPPWRSILFIEMLRKLFASCCSENEK